MQIEKRTAWVFGALCALGGFLSGACLINPELPLLAALIPAGVIAFSGALFLKLT